MNFRFYFSSFQEREKKLEKLQTMTGAVGHISCEMIVDINTEVVRLMSTIQEFSDPAVVIEDARREASEIFSAIKGLLLIDKFVSFNKSYS